MSDNKSPQVSRTLLSILVDFNNALDWMVLIRFPIYNFSSLLSKPLWTVPRAPITIRIIAILMFHSFLCSPARFKYLSFFFSLIFTVVSREDKVRYAVSSRCYCCCCLVRSGFVAYFVFLLTIPLNLTTHPDNIHSMNLETHSFFIIYFLFIFCQYLQHNFVELFSNFNSVV